METIGFDLDGVLYDFHTAAYKHLSIYHGENSGLENFWKTKWPIYSEMFKYNFVRIPVLYEVFDLNERDSVVLNKIAETKNIIYVTHRPTEVISATKAWMKHNNLPYKDNIYFIEDKSIPIMLNKCSYFIDDNLEVVKSLNNKTNAILYKKPWHDENDLSDITYITRLSDLLEFEL